ncbi:MAG TPA: thioredoxin domain-containing protein [Bacteroidia bacterium]|nr:thioredoxin domain-containing protein [Bacteroidia bacterium]
MKKLLINNFLVLLLILSACSNGQNAKFGLSATEFNEKLKQTPDAQLVDVRTPDEYQGGHLNNAVNYDWNGNNFGTQIEKLDKQKPVFVYCLAGSRSASAAANMRAAGFKTVYEMNGGIMKWRAAGLPESTGNNSLQTKGMSLSEYNKLIQSHKGVLIDFYAEWCAPCKKMKPYLDEIAVEMKSDVKVLRIDADQNKELLQELKIDGLPVLILYKGGKQTWRNDGFIEKNKVVAQIKL